MQNRTLTAFLVVCLSSLVAVSLVGCSSSTSGGTPNNNNGRGMMNQGGSGGGSSSTTGSGMPGNGTSGY